MKTHCSKDALLTGVNTVQKAVSGKNVEPDLQSIFLQAEPDKLIFLATDMEIGIRCEVPAQTETEGTLLLPAKLFSDIVRKLPDTQITIESESQSANLQYYQSEIFLKGYDPEQFPLLPDLLDPVSFSLPSESFKTMIRETLIAAAQEESRPIFKGLLLEMEGSVLRLIATDTHRLAYSQSGIDNPNGLNFSGIVPAKTMSEIYRLLKDDDDFITVRFTGSHVSFQFGAVHLLTRLIEGQFPNYKQVIPSSCRTKIRLFVKDFMESVERASLLARDSSAGVSLVRLEISGDLLKIEHTTDIGKISEQLSIEKEGADLTISFNSRFILDVLRVLPSEQMRFELSGPQSAAIIRTPAGENYLYLLLPVRTN
ncbi:DNA polymerase III subunit beta [Peptococcaceae bacterium CEB3]|nr:DNA polymerase III subunit beta [Peptococcaceae bacterium CEB3]